MNKKIFISYAWGDKEHQEWVVDLGKRLMQNTVDVVLDRWSLKDGHDIHAFMESMVKSDDIFRVLIICDKNYTNKANDRNGGVGTETQIITPAIYNDQKQEKFIPIVLEKDEKGKPYLPIYLSSRKYIDFSNEEYFESSYEELLRNVLEVPAVPKPKLGTSIPLYITESPTNDSEISSLVRVIENQLKKHPEKANSYLSNFLNIFSEKMWDFELKNSSHDLKTFGEELVENLLSFKVLRDDYINCLLIITKEEYTIDVDVLIDFFAKAFDYYKPKQDRSGWSSADFDNFKIIFQELFLYTIAICIKNKNYGLIGELFHSKYYTTDQYKPESTKRFTFLYQYHENLENYYYQHHNKTTGFGHYVITNLNENILKEDVILADTLCHYVGDLYKEGDYKDKWFPTTHLYKGWQNNLDFFNKMTSLRFFNKIKSIFDVDQIQDLKNILQTYGSSKKDVQRVQYGRGFGEQIPFIHEVINIDSIGENR